MFLSCTGRQETEAGLPIRVSTAITNNLLGVAFPYQQAGDNVHSHLGEVLCHVTCPNQCDYSCKYNVIEAMRPLHTLSRDGELTVNV